MEMSDLLATMPYAVELGMTFESATPDEVVATLDWSEARTLEFEPPDLEAFPCLGLAYRAGRMGGTAPAWLNAANEVAVAAFLETVIPWRAIAEVISDVLEDHDGTTANSVDVVIDADRRARERARRAVQQRAR